MGLEWSMVDENLDNDDGIEAWLQRDYEPFAVWGGNVYLKKQIITERDELKSSTKPENKNLAGDEPDFEELRGDDSG